jgi:hypothetical protein
MPKGPGYFKFDRLLRDELAAELEPVSRLLIQDLMILARGVRSRCKVRIPGEDGKRYLQPGEWITSSAKLSAITGLSSKTIRRKLATLCRILPWFRQRMIQGDHSRGGLWYHVDMEAAERWANDRTGCPVVDGDRTESPVGRGRPDRESSRTLHDRTESPVATGQRVQSQNATKATKGRRLPKKGRIRKRLKRNRKLLSATSPDTGAVRRSLSALENPTLSEQARRAVGEIIHRWGNSNGFKSIAALDDALAYRLETEPTRCVAQVFDVGQAKAPRNIFALLLSRLKEQWKKDPSDTLAWPFSRSVMNSGRRRGKGPESLGGIFERFGMQDPANKTASAKKGT